MVGEEHRGEIDGGDRRYDADPERSGHDPCSCGCAFLRLLSSLKRRSRVHNERFSGLAQTDAAYTLWFRGVQQLPVIAPGLLALLSPIVATVRGVAIAGECFTAIQAIGLTLTLGALVVGQILARPATSNRTTLEEPIASASQTAPR